MSEGKQEARENEISITIRGREQVAIVMEALHKAGFSARQANQPQGKAQPESGEMGQEIAYRLNVKPGDALYPPAEALWRTAFQRGQQAMAEKAAQHDLHPGIITMMCSCGKAFHHELFVAIPQWQEHIRSLASAAPPQEKS